jgi:flavin-dependent dehydrogenase
MARRFAMSRKLIVVGGGAGGPSAAAKARRLDPDLAVTVLEAGEHVSFST